MVMISAAAPPRPPAATHRAVHRWPETAPCLFHGLPSGPTVIRVQVCGTHAADLTWRRRRHGTARRA